MSKKYTDKDLANILAEVEVEFQKHLKTDKETVLAKSEQNAAPAVESTEAQADVAYDDADQAEVEKLYKEMSKSEAEVHYKAVKKAMFGEGEEVIAKSESSDESKLLKSENETLKSENEDLKKSIAKITETLTKMFGKKDGAPKQKAVTSIEVMKKSEEAEVKVAAPVEKDISKLSPSQINATLVSKIRNGDMKKSDKDAVQKYFDSNAKNIELVKHLL